jgi:hypothetical protein
LIADSVSEQIVDLEHLLATELQQVAVGRRETGQFAEERQRTIHIQ